ncbi:hypothetical protein J2X63_003212 [Agromyces sp. 3263]|uniref:hypothetical protein n=1 Tax=Agromyces sp. 3263 TaxID=2817750 RepID=UPI002854B293|nr:hypothetical protein [Agromyces sp. 3263]MDR6907504.1 hypothetical protein [Agromyces sp. 3263]
MTRNRKSAAAAGTAFELSIANYLSFEVDDRIERRVKHGANDRGDIGGVRVLGNRVVLECKDYGGTIKAGEWIKEAHTEMGNDDAVAGIVVAKRKGTTKPGEQWVLMTVDDLIALIQGERP